MSRTVCNVGVALITALSVAGLARAQDRWWEQPEAPPETPTQADEPETAAEDPDAIRVAPGTGTGADPGVREPEVYDPDGLDSPPGQNLGDMTGAPVLGGLDTTWRWQQVLASPRIGATLTAVAVDPGNPNRIFVGTEEGTIVRSQDGGITWRELEMDPFVATRRSFAVQTPGLPQLGERVFGGLTLLALPPGQSRPVNIPTIPFVRTPQYETLSTNFVSGRYIRPFIIDRGPPETSLLADAVRGRTTTPVQLIAVCTGAEFPLLVASQNELMGSNDGGLTYVRLLRLPGRVSVRGIACSRRNPRHVMVATSFGMFRSTDGGVSYDPDLTAQPGNSTWSVAFGPGPDGEERAYVATSSLVYAGDPDSDEGLDFVYPDFNNAATAPWEEVYWVETTADGHVWIATKDGVRASFDMGQTWETVAGTLLSRQQSWQVKVGVNEGGGRRVAVLVRDCPTNRCRSSLIYASDDNGQTWFPFFQGATRRNINQMAAAPSAPGIPPRWWAVAGGELWATVPGETITGPDVDRRSSAWARQQLRDAPDMHLVIDAVLDELELNEDHIADMFSTIRFRNFAPRIQLEFFFTQSNFTRTEDVLVGGSLLMTRFDEQWSRSNYLVRGWLEWRFREMAYTESELSPRRNEIYTLRIQVAFVIEDAWHERTLLLQRIARGMSDRLQVEILKERIAALEAVIETWLRRPIGSLPRGGMRIEEINP